MLKVVNSRPADRNQELSKLLKQAGFEPVEIPFVEIRADEDCEKKLMKLQPSGFTGIFLSSPNGLRHFQGCLLPSQFEAWIDKPFYLVGSAARPLVEEAGGKVAFVPETSSLEGFLDEYRPAPEPGKLPMAQRWLHPCSASTRLDPAAFRQRGIEVVNLPVYRPGLPPDLGESLGQLAADTFAIIFCSGSAVDNFFQTAPELAATLNGPKGPMALSIGPSTTRALEAHGIKEARQSLHADNESLVDALKEACSGSKTVALKAEPAKKPAASKSKPSPEPKK